MNHPFISVNVLNKYERPENMYLNVNHIASFRVAGVAPLSRDGRLPDNSGGETLVKVVMVNGQEFNVLMSMEKFQTIIARRFEYDQNT